MKEIRTMKQTLHFILNGEPVQAEIEPHLTLLQLLRDELELTGTKEGCSMGECGACTVLLDGKTLNSCIFPALEVEGKSVTTIEGMADAKEVSIPSRRLSLSMEPSSVVSVPPGWSFLPRPFSMKTQNQQKRRFGTESLATCAAVPDIYRLFRPSRLPAANNEIT